MDDRRSDNSGAARQGPLAGLREFIGLGGLLGACHAVAETTVLGWYGADLAILDVAILIAAYSLLGCVGGAALWMGLLPIAALLGGRAPLAGARARRRWFVAPSMIAYVGMGCWLVAGASRGWVVATCVPVVVLSGLWVVFFAARRAGDIPGLVAALLGACLLTSGATIYAAAAPEVSGGNRALLAAGVVLFAIVPIGISFRRMRAGERSALLVRSGIPALACLLAADLCLWIVIWPTALGWQVPAGEEAARRTRDGRPDVLLIVLDTVRADHMDLFGYGRETMPHLGAFARADCAVAAPITATAPSSLASHGSIFTGMYPSSHGGHKPFADDPDPPPCGYFVRDDVPTLAERLGEAGYRTAGISANHGVLSSFGLPRGFAEYDARPARSFLAERLSWLGAFRIRGRAASRLIRYRFPPALMRGARWLSPDLPPYRRADEIADRAIAWLDTHAGEPVFLFLNFMDAHSPYLPVEGLGARFAPRPQGIAWTGDPGHLVDARPTGAEGLPREVIDFVVGQYDAEMVFLDRQCDRLLDHLKSTGRYDDAMIIVVSDHGESFLEHGQFEHGRSLYETQLSVPLLIKLPRSSGETPPASVRHMQFVDLFPTIMDVVGGETPTTVQGSAWGAGRDYAISERFARTWEADRARGELFAVRIGDWKYIRSHAGEEECYDLASDPGERRNILGSRPDLEERARRIFARRNAVMLREPADRIVDRATLDRMRAMGYVK